MVCFNCYCFLMKLEYWLENGMSVVILDEKKRNLEYLVNSLCNLNYSRLGDLLTGHYFYFQWILIHVKNQKRIIQERETQQQSITLQLTVLRKEWNIKLVQRITVGWIILFLV